VTETVALYGFGSSFAGRATLTSDVDLLIVHEDHSARSLRVAIGCKKLLRAAIPSADIVMLSQAEERDHDFLRKSCATFLANISPEQISEYVAMIRRLTSSRHR